jgi:hypothetical protein
LLQINLQWYTLISGVSFAPLEFPTRVSLPHVEGAWLNSTCRFLAHSRSQLLIPTPPLQRFREHDHLIMDVVIRLNYSASQIRQVNWCRLYLQASRLSEITILVGTAIHPAGAWTGAAHLASHHNWPQQGCPGPKAWLGSLGRMLMLCQQPLGRVLASEPGMLSTPLGPWHLPSQPFQLARWAAFLDPS